MTLSVIDVVLTDRESAVVCVPALFRVQLMIRPRSRRLLIQQINTRCDLSVCSNGTWML